MECEFSNIRRAKRVRLGASSTPRSLHPSPPLSPLALAGAFDAALSIAALPPLLELLATPPLVALDCLDLSANTLGADGAGMLAQALRPAGALSRSRGRATAAAPSQCSTAP